MSGEVTLTDRQLRAVRTAVEQYLDAMEDEADELTPGEWDELQALLRQEWERRMKARRQAGRGPWRTPSTGEAGGAGSTGEAGGEAVGQVLELRRQLEEQQEVVQELGERCRRLVNDVGLSKAMRRRDSDRLSKLENLVEVLRGKLDLHVKTGHFTLGGGVGERGWY